jgi:predicted nuclease with TOPRIM domain
MSNKQSKTKLWRIMGGGFIVVMLVFGVLRFITGKPDKVTHTQKTVAIAEYEALKQENEVLKQELTELKIKYNEIQETLDEAEVESEELKAELEKKASNLRKELVVAVDNKPVREVVGDANSIAEQLSIILN